MKRILAVLSLALISALSLGNGGCNDAPKRQQPRAWGTIRYIEKGASVVNGGHTYTIVIEEHSGAIWSVETCCIQPPVWVGLDGVFEWSDPDSQHLYVHDFWVIRRMN